MRKGQGHSEESRKKISDSMTGKRKSAETKEKMAFAATMRWNKTRNKRRLLKELSAPLNSTEDLPRASNGLSEAFSAEGTPVA